MCENDSKKFNDKYLIKSKEELEECSIVNI